LFDKNGYRRYIERCTLAPFVLCPKAGAEIGEPIGGRRQTSHFV
jgi:hypothetical protein